MFEDVHHENVQTQTPTVRYSNAASSNIAGTVDQAAQESATSTAFGSETSNLHATPSQSSSTSCE